MTYDESAALMIDPTFRSRVKVACLKFADFIDGEDASTPGHNARLRWAVNCFQSPDQTAAQIQPPTVMDAQVQTDGAAITDTALQTAVETTVEKMF
jgi:hypothetical protein